MSKSMGAASTHSERQKKCKYQEDYISKLPFDVIVSILSRLTLKEAAKTSILSRHWRFLWTYIPSLNFEGEQLNRKSYVTQRLRFQKWVNQVIKSYQAPNLEEFRVMMDLDSGSAPFIDNWVNFAMERGVKRLELDFSGSSKIHRLGRYTFLPRCTTFKQLRSRPLGFSSCHSLTSLQLYFVNITEMTLQYLLSSCLLLECLCVTGSKSLVNFEVSRPVDKLKYLEICDCYNMEKFELSAKNLVRLKYEGPRITWSLKNASKLVELHIEGGSYQCLVNYCHQLSSYLPQLESLVFKIFYMGRLQHLEFPLLKNLKTFKLMASVLHGEETPVDFTTAFLKAAPLLSEFTVKLGCSGYHFHNQRDDPRELIKVTECPHPCLKVVKFDGWLGKPIHTKLAMYFLENAIALEQIHFYIPDTSGDMRDIDEAKRRAKQLQAEFKGDVDFIIT